MLNDGTFQFTLKNKYGGIYVRVCLCYYIAERALTREGHLCYLGQETDVITQHLE
jgi:hypothetical protein